ncbi:MAG: cytochrome c, partial [Gemmataceae bacterium]|nr:cytochrome c [Gemmataceae bacterium]
MTRVLSVPLLAGLCVLAGCESYLRYPKDYRYQLRKDVLVTEPPTAQPDHLPAPGEIDKGILAALNRDKDGKKGDGKHLDPAKLSADERKELREALDEQFGTPRLPKVAIASGTDTLFGKDIEHNLYAGSELYRKHCMHCHGVSGDGRGPTGPWVHPHPRDYRSGKFKFISTDRKKANSEKPRRQDLLRTLERGIDGTSMPAFGSNLGDAELDQLVSYVIHLSIRGETEFRTLSTLLGNENRKSAAGDVAKEVDKQVKAVFPAWQRATG